MASLPADAQPAALLDALVSGSLSKDEVLRALRRCYVEDLGFARIDHDRAERCGIPEVIYGAGKPPLRIAALFARIAAQAPNVICTRASTEAAAKVKEEIPAVEHDRESGVLYLWRDRSIRGVGPVLVLTAGTSDLPVAREAELVAALLGNQVEILADVGVAGLHRLLQERERLGRARVLIVVAGLDAALPSVVAGVVDRPVIAVPTSVGYGASFGGLTALLSALNACAAGVTVVNIDNGFGAAVAATLMNRP